MTDSAMTPDEHRRADENATGPMMAADGRPLKASLNRALRRQKMRALLLIAPLLLFVLVTFIAPIADMLFRSIENQIVSETLPRTTAEIANWDADAGEIPSPEVFNALFKDMFIATERKAHTRKICSLQPSAKRIRDWGHD